jgi:hypothetical protein
MEVEWSWCRLKEVDGDMLFVGCCWWSVVVGFEICVVFGVEGVGCRMI